MRIFITGIAGYAGFHAAIRCAAGGHRVVGLTRTTARRRLDILRTREVSLIEGDVARVEDYQPALEAADVIVHSLLDWRHPLETDRALFAALEALPKHTGTQRRLIYMTGCSIYGKLPDAVMDERTEPNPEHALAFRRTLEIEALNLDLSTVVLRPGFMYGNDGHSSATVDWFLMAKSGDAVFYGDRDKGWSWVHIDDLADAILTVAQGGAEIDGEVFCLADPFRPRCLEVMRRCLDVAGYHGEIRFAPIAPGERAARFDQNEFITSAKARRVLGWVPRRPGVLDGAAAAFAAWEAAQHLHGGGRVKGELAS